MTEIELIDTLGAIRKRPGMYVGDTSDGSGLHHLLWWAFDDFLDNARAGRGSFFKVALYRDGSCKITDNGPALADGKGSVVDRLEKVTSELLCGGDRGIASPEQVRTYLPVLRALSSKMSIKVRVNGEVYGCRYERGKQIGEWGFTEFPEYADTQFRVQFWPDPEIFSSTKFNVDYVRTRLEQMAATCPALLADLYHEDSTVSGVYEPIRMPNGMADMVGLIAAKAGEHGLEPKKPFRLRVHQDEVAFDVAVQWHWGEVLKEPTWLSWANTIKTSKGSHVLGVRDAIKDVGLDDVPYIATVSVFVPKPRFTNAVKDCLRNPEIRVLLRDHLTPALRRLAEDDEFALSIDWMRTRRGQEDWKRAQEENS